mmetsp:Transcript_20351/g.59008  ORF Transcript_20351/g.59008 Transcript_20351/m.59008 type:complete len:405 (+) Transcript_20351:2785-3999(+)
MQGNTSLSMVMGRVAQPTEKKDALLHGREIRSVEVRCGALEVSVLQGDCSTLCEPALLLHETQGQVQNAKALDKDECLPPTRQQPTCPEQENPIAIWWRVRIPQRHRKAPGRVADHILEECRIVRAPQGADQAFSEIDKVWPSPAGEVGAQRFFEALRSMPSITSVAPLASSFPNIRGLLKESGRLVCKGCLLKLIAFDEAFGGPFPQLCRREFVWPLRGTLHRGGYRQEGIGGFNILLRTGSASSDGCRLLEEHRACEFLPQVGNVAAGLRRPCKAQLRLRIAPALEELLAFANKFLDRAALGKAAEQLFVVRGLLHAGDDANRLGSPKEGNHGLRRIVVVDPDTLASARDRDIQRFQPSAQQAIPSDIQRRNSALVDATGVPTGRLHVPKDETPQARPPIQR